VLAYSDTGDYFSFTANAGTATINADVIPAWTTYARSNLDVSMTLYNAAGAVVASVNPAGSGSPMTTLPAAMTAVLPAAGFYYVQVGGGAMWWTYCAAAGACSSLGILPPPASAALACRPS
jgi:hypothetical protein